MTLLALTTIDVLVSYRDSDRMMTRLSMNQFHYCLAAFSQRERVRIFAF